ncbi:MAG TPA: AsmA-like C-terminal region-containing protein, partial [Chitinophagaceae bacterium]|nr:AsmA-like C-terminal region-containing protein [Chitinophagaceae bacterium]
TKTLHFEKIRLNADRQRLILSGNFQFGTEKKFTLQVNGDKLQYSKGIALLPKKITDKLALYDVNVPLNVTADIEGGLVFGAATKVNVQSTVNNATVKTDAGDFTNSDFHVEFSNAVNDTLPYVDENSGLLFTDFRSNWEGIQLNSKKIEINNLINPFMRADLTTSTDLASLNKLLNSNSFDFTSGEVSAKVNYAGAFFSDTTTSITGEMILNGGNITYAPRQVKLDKINGRFEFENSDVIIKNLSAEAEGNKVNINATVRNMVNMLSTDPSKLFVEASVSSPFIDLKSFRRMVGNRRKVKSASKGKFGRIAEKIDRFMEDCSISTQLKAEKLKYNSFTATDVNAQFSMNADAWNIKDVSLIHSNGAIKINGTLTSKERNYNIATLNVNMNNLDVMKVFQAFDNFGLASLHSENLRGKLSSNMRLTAVLDDESNLLPALLNGSIFLSLKNGELLDFEPLQKMSVFVLKKRDFSHLQFAELRDSFEINGSKLTIHKMEIQSNVLGLLVEGIYDIKGKVTDLVVQVPLKYLKKRDPDYIPENQGVDAKKGVSIYVRATNADNGEIDFKYGIFKKKSILEKNQKKANSIP